MCNVYGTLDAKANEAEEVAATAAAVFIQLKRGYELITISELHSKLIRCKWMAIKWESTTTATHSSGTNKRCDRVKVGKNAHNHSVIVMLSIWIEVISILKPSQPQ